MANSKTLKGTKLMQKKLSAQWTAWIWQKLERINFFFYVLFFWWSNGNTAEILHFWCLVFVWHCEKWRISNAWCTYFLVCRIPQKKKTSRSRQTEEKKKRVRCSPRKKKKAAERRKSWNILGFSLNFWYRFAIEDWLLGV